jgi:hypothetical protein
MVAKRKRKPAIPEPQNPPDSFDRAQMLKAIRELAAAQRRLKKRPTAPPSAK